MLEQPHTWWSIIMVWYVLESCYAMLCIKHLLREECWMNDIISHYPLGWAHSTPFRSVDAWFKMKSIVAVAASNHIPMIIKLQFLWAAQQKVYNAPPQHPEYWLEETRSQLRDKHPITLSARDWWLPSTQSLWSAYIEQQLKDPYLDIAIINWFFLVLGPQLTPLHFLKGLDRFFKGFNIYF